MLEAATVLNSLLIHPGDHLEALKGDRKGHYSIRINDQFQAKHKLDTLVAQFGGKQGAYEAIAQAAERAVAGTAGPFQTTVQVGTETVVVRGSVIDGVVKISTAFKP